MLLKDNFTGINTLVLRDIPNNILCICLRVIYERKPWLPRRQVVDGINSKNIEAFFIEGDVVLSMSEYDRLDKIFFQYKLNRKRYVEQGRN